MGYKVFPVAASGLHAPISVFAPRTRKSAPPTRISLATPSQTESRDDRAPDAVDEREGGDHQSRSASSSQKFRSVSYTHLTLPTTPYV